MDAKHTPGPWIAGDDEDSDYLLIGPEECPGLVARPIVKLHCEADAKLIAAAPELLKALRSALQTAEFEGHAFRPWHADAKAVIAKATE